MNKDDKKELKPKKVRKEKNVENKLDKKDKIIRIAILSVVIIATVIFATFIGVSYLKSRTKPEEVAPVKIDDAIDSYGYQLAENATPYYKELFNKLKILLNTPDFEEEEYGKLITQMFAADFYDLNTKLTNSDIGGMEFVTPLIRENFRLAAQNTIYSGVENNIYGDRTQKLPVVKSINVTSVNRVNYNYQGKGDPNAMRVSFTIEYEEDLGYPKESSVVLVHLNDKLEITKVN